MAYFPKGKTTGLRDVMTKQDVSVSVHCCSFKWPQEVPRPDLLQKHAKANRTTSVFPPHCLDLKATWQETLVCFRGGGETLHFFLFLLLATEAAEMSVATHWLSSMA